MSFDEMGTKMKLPRLTPEQAWILNQHVMCGKSQGTPEQIAEAKRLNQEFIQQYREIDSIDLYLALSMRSLEDIQGAEIICNALEEKGYSVYNPGNNCETSRYTKHDLEKHMLLISKALVLDAGTKDSGGKFIEACNAKFEYCMPIFFLAEDEHQYKVYHDYHPMGVLLGPHVCRTLDELMLCLTDELNGRSNSKAERVEGKTNLVCSNCDSVVDRY